MCDVVASLSDNREGVFRRLEGVKDKLAVYDFLQQKLRSICVDTDREFQTRYKGFYRVRRNDDWCSSYFRLFESRKNSEEVSFKDILVNMADQTGRIEASFSSKMLATISPDKPVFDLYVRVNTNLQPPAPYKPIQYRIECFVDCYQVMTDQFSSYLKDDGFRDLKIYFDRAFPAFSHFTDMKKLDLMLWQSRDVAN